MAQSLILLAVISSAASIAPSRPELAKALSEFTGKPVSTADVRRVSCKRIDEEPTEAFCRWQQKRNREWERFSTYLAVDGRGWHLIDEPNPIR